MASIGSSGFVTQPPGEEHQLLEEQLLESEMPASSQSTLLLQKKKEMAEVQAQLDRKKEEFRQRMQRCQEKEVELAAKQEAIKEQVRKFDKFLKDNDAKRVRANRKAMEEVKLREQKEAEKQLLVQELERQKDKAKELQAELSKKAIYEQFLEHVCETFEYFEDIENVLKRYETLEAAHRDLQSRVEDAEVQTEDNSATLVSHVKKTQTDSLVFNSQIANLQTSLDTMRLGAQNVENDLTKRELDAKEGVRQLGEMTMAIQNIYGRCRVRGAQPPDANENRSALYLDAIQQRVLDLQDIVLMHERHERLAKQQAAAAAAASAAAAAAALQSRAEAEQASHRRVQQSQQAERSSSRRAGGSVIMAAEVSANASPKGSVVLAQPRAPRAAVPPTLGKINGAAVESNKTLPRLT